MVLADFGTSYTKIMTVGDPAAKVVPSREVSRSFRADLATGHNGRKRAARYVNELIALARGGEALIGRDDFLLLDCGSRDIKFVRYRGGRLDDMGWNAECGASMGFTIELLERYYDLDFSRGERPEKSFPVTCGVLGMSSIFDAITSGMDEKEAVASFIRGIAENAYRFAGSPDEIFLSGGLCENRVFVASFPCKVTVLGRFVLLEGLKRIADHGA